MELKKQRKQTNKKDVRQKVRDDDIANQEERQCNKKDVLKQTIMRNRERDGINETDRNTNKQTGR